MPARGIDPDARDEQRSAPPVPQGPQGPRGLREPRERRGHGGRGGHRGVLLAGLLLLAAGTWIVLELVPYRESGGTTGRERFVRTAEPLEPAPGPVARMPEPPGPGAGVEELWRYGERFLGWTPAADVDLTGYAVDELRRWIRQDRSFYAQEESALHAEEP